MNKNASVNEEPSLESRVAARLAQALTARAEALPHDVTERLRVAREVALANRPRAVASPRWVGLTASGEGLLSGGATWWQRAAAALPLAALVVGLMAIERWSMRENVLEAADLDVRLLADDLPPTAYSDPGFAEYLRSAPSP
jgi:hypothetical protein